MNLILIDDDELVLTSLKTILENDPDIQVSATGNHGEDAISLYNTYHPDVLLMDIRMEKMTGIEAATKILSQHPQAKILFLTTFSDDDYILKALKIGVKGYLLKQNFASLITSVKAVYSGQNVFGDEIITKIPNLLTPSKKADFSSFGITEKESEIISFIADGLSNKEIADQTYFSEGTIRNYISTILEKLHLRDRTQIAIFYYKTQ